MTDVLVGPNGEVYLNGVRITHVSAFNMDQGMHGPTRIQLEFCPTSVVQVQPPQAVFSDTAGLSDPDARVDIKAAIERAKKRAEKKTP